MDCRRSWDFGCTGRLLFKLFDDADGDETHIQYQGEALFVPLPIPLPLPRWEGSLVLARFTWY